MAIAAERSAAQNPAYRPTGIFSTRAKGGISLKTLGPDCVCVRMKPQWWRKRLADRNHRWLTHNRRANELLTMMAAIEADRALKHPSVAQCIKLRKSQARGKTPYRRPCATASARAWCATSATTKASASSLCAMSPVASGDLNSAVDVFPQPVPRKLTILH